MVGSDREVSEIIGTDVDVTEQYAARQRLENTLAALQESEQRVRYYAETASDWLGIPGRITCAPVFRNTRALQASGRPSSLAWLVGTLRAMSRQNLRNGSSIEQR